MQINCQLLSPVRRVEPAGLSAAVVQLYGADATAVLCRRPTTFR